VRASTRPPRSAAYVPVRSLSHAYSARAADGASTFQLSGRSAATDIADISARWSSVKGPTVGMNSSVVPGCSRATPASAISSSGVAQREGTGLPSPSLCVVACEDEKPIPPAASDSPSSRHIASSCSAVAALPTASSPITTQRIAEWPTRNPAFTARPPSMRSRYSPKVRQSYGTAASSDSSGIPSTRASMRVM